MKLLRRAIPATPVPPPPPTVAEGHTTRRVEVIVEREWEREWAREAVSPSVAPVASFEAHCSACGTRVPMFTPAAAALLAQVTVRTIYRWVDEKKLHFLESPAGELYLCARTLQAPTPVPTRQLPSGDPR